MAESNEGRARDRPPGDRARRAARAGGAARRRALGLRLVHEIGNLLAAIRLESHLIDAPGGELRSTRERLDALAVDAGALLAQIRSILGGAAAKPRVSAESILASLVGAFDEPMRARLDVAAPAVQVADARLAVDADAAYQLLLILTRRALEAAGEEGRVALSVEPRRGQLVFELALRRAGQSAPTLLPPSLEVLLPAVAEALGGQLVLRAGAGGGAARLSLPRDGARARIPDSAPASGGA